MASKKSEKKASLKSISKDSIYVPVDHVSCLTAAVHVASGRLCHAVKEACLDPGLAGTSMLAMRLVEQVFPLPSGPGPGSHLPLPA